jgi:hypothetical protein
MTRVFELPELTYEDAPVGTWRGMQVQPRRTPTTAFGLQLRGDRVRRLAAALVAGQSVTAAALTAGASRGVAVKVLRVVQAARAVRDLPPLTPPTGRRGPRRTGPQPAGSVPRQQLLESFRLGCEGHWRIAAA